MSKDGARRRGGRRRRRRRLLPDRRRGRGDDGDQGGERATRAHDGAGHAPPVYLTPTAAQACSTARAAALAGRTDRGRTGRWPPARCRTSPPKAACRRTRGRTPSRSDRGSRRRRPRRSHPTCGSCRPRPRDRRRGSPRSSSCAARRRSGRRCSDPGSRDGRDRPATAARRRSRPGRPGTDRAHRFHRRVRRRGHRRGDDVGKRLGERARLAPVHEPGRPVEHGVRQLVRHEVGRERRVGPRPPVDAGAGGCAFPKHDHPAVPEGAAEVAGIRGPETVPVGGRGRMHDDLHGRVGLVEEEVPRALRK